MNPWAMEQLAHDRRAGFRRAALAAAATRSSRGSSAAGRSRRPPLVRAAGVLLMRAGARLVGPGPIGDAPAVLGLAAPEAVEPC